MAYGLPAYGETGWKPKLDASIEAVKATAEAALPAAPANVDAAVAARVNDSASSTRAALSATFAKHDEAAPTLPGNNLTKMGVVFDVGAAGGFDATRVEFGGAPFYDPRSGRWAVLYTGYGTDTGVERGSIGVAFSDDLVTWDTRTQIIARSGVAGSADEHGVTAPVCLMWDGTYYVFVAGLTATGYEGGSGHKVVLYSSTDLTAAVGSWTRHGVVMSPDPGVAWRAGNLWLCNFVQVGGKIYNFINASRADFSECIGLFEAAHPEGPWTPRDDVSPLLEPLGAGTKEETITANPFVSRVAGGWRMDYFGVGQGGAFDFYATTTDEQFPTGWVRGNGGEPILSPGPAGSIDELYAHKPTIVRAGDRLYHYYTAVMAGDTNRRQAVAVEGGISSATVALTEVAAPRTTTSTTGEPVPLAGILFDCTGKKQLQGRLTVRANPGGATLYIYPYNDLPGVVPASAIVTLSGASWQNGATEWFPVGSSALEYLYIAWKVTAGTAQFGGGTWEFRWLD